MVALQLSIILTTNIESMCSIFRCYSGGFLGFWLVTLLALNLHECFLGLHIETEQRIGYEI